MIPISAVIDEPARGTWVADIVTAELPTGAFELGEITWTGTISPAGYVLDGSRYRCRVIGGAAKLATVLPEKNYPGAIPWSTIARDIARECGERVGALGFTGSAPYYERGLGTGGDALAELCRASGATWWVSRDGALQLEQTRPGTVVDESSLPRLGLDVDGTVTFNVTQSAATVSPGQTVDGRVLRALRWQLEPSRLLVDCSPSQVDAGALPADFYRLMYEAKVDSQNADGSVNVIANEKFFMRNVRLLSGLPGSRVSVHPGEMVAVGFFAGNRSKPYAQCFAQDSEASLALGLVEDAVEIVLPPFTFSGLVSGVTPIAGVMTAVIPKTLGKLVGPGSTRTKSK